MTQPDDDDYDTVEELIDEPDDHDHPKGHRP
jgi:hypothetical protein